MMDRNFGAVWMSQRYWRKNKIAQSFALLTVVALAATGTFAVEDTAKLAGSGLSGIFPSVPPADLSDEEFSKLDGNWADWSKGASATVADFYGKLASSDIPTQRRALGNLKIKLDVMRRALDDSRYSSIHSRLAALYNSLNLRIEFAEAALDTLEIDGARLAGTKIGSRTAELRGSITSLEGYLASIGNGPLWLNYFKINELKAALTADPLGIPALDAAKNTQNVLLSRDYVLDDAQKEFTHRGPFEVVAGAIGRYLSVATWNNSAEATKTLRAEFKTLAESLDSFASTGEKSAYLRQAFGRVRFISADSGERLTATLQKRLFNYNLRLLATEDFLNRLMSQDRSETGVVRDCILGASVSGCQMTNTSINLDLLPSSNTAKFALRLNGTIHSTTTATTPEATVWSSGHHTFAASKEVDFNGQNFWTQPASIQVSPHNQTTGLRTKFSWIPIIRHIANSIAANEVEAKRPQAEAITASRVQDAVLPRFNSEVESNFATAGDKLNREFFGGLRSSNLFPDTYHYSTSDRMLTMNARLMTDNQVAADAPESSLLTATGATALLHESIVNNAVDQMGIAGQTLTEVELREKIELFLTKALNRPFKFDAPPPAAPDEDEEAKSLSAIIFTKDDPIRIRIQDDQLLLVIHAGFRREGKDDIPPREITIPITFEVAGTKINVKRGNVVVTDLEGSGGALDRSVRTKISSLLPDRSVDGKVEFKTPDKTMVAYVTRLRFLDGWASVSID